MTPIDLTTELVLTVRALCLAQTQLTERNIKLAADRAVILRAELEADSSVAKAERMVEMTAAQLLGDVERERGKIASLTTRRDLLVTLLSVGRTNYAHLDLDDLPPL